MFKKSFLWAILLAASSVAKADSVVVFNEVMYHPAANEAALEWIELHNQQAVDVDLSQWRLSNGIDFTFPSGTRIAGRGYLVVALNPSALQASVPGLAGVIGPFTGRLSNSGEKLALSDNSGRVLDEFSYGTDDAWPAAADGAGPSLAKRSPTLGSDHPDAWTQSAQIGGTPGAANFPGPLGAAATVSFNEVGAAGAGFFIELINHGAAVVNLEGFILSCYSGGTASFVLPAQSLAPGALVLVNAAQLGVTAADGDRFVLLNPARTEALDAASVGVRGQARQTALGQWAFPNGPTPGAANTFTLHGEVVINEIFYHGRPTLPEPATTQTSKPIRFSSVWKYDQAGEDLGSAWRTAGYDDGAWASGSGLLASSNGAVAYPDTVLADSPLAYWKLDESTTSMADATGHAHTGTATAGLIRGSEPLVSGDSSSKAITLLGSNRITVPGFEKVGTAGYTVEFWLRILTPATGFMNLVGDGESSGDFFLMNYLTPGQIVRPHFGFGNSPVSLDGNSSLQVGQTYYITTTWDAVNTVNNGVIFINGTPDRTGTVSRNVPAIGGTGNNTVFIGYDNREAATGSYVIDEVALYNYPLSPARVAAHYIAGTAPGPRNTTLAAGPKTHYFRSRFDFNGNPANSRLSLNLALDDGAVVWLNGVELYRHNMPDGAVTYGTPARGDIPAQAFTGAIDLPAGALVAGTNTIAVEVHQSAANDDVLFGLELSTIETLTPAIPFSDSSEQWIELLNRSGAPVDLSGWRLDNGPDYLFPPNTSLAPGAYLVVAKDPAALLAKFPGITVLGPFKNKLSGSGDKVVLKDQAGNKADSVEYRDRGRWPATADGGGSSLELRDPRADNSIPESWAASDETTRGGWQTYTYRVTANDTNGPTRWNEFDLGLLDAGECLIDDISVIESPATAPVQKIGNGNFNGGATGWRFLGDHRLSAVEAETGNPGNQVLHIRASDSMEHMHNHIESTYLNNTPIVNGREYEISFRAKLLSGSRQLHTRLYFNRAARLTVLAAPAQMGTPGSGNSRFTSNTGPVFSNLRHGPTVPQASQAVTVSIEAADPDDLSGVTLFYSVAGGTFSSVPMANNAGTWSAAIPGQNAGAIAQFYIHAVDGAGAAADFPSLGANSRVLVIWNDGLANLPIAHNVRLLLSAADRAFLFANTNLMSNELLRGTVVYDESEVFYDVGIRLKGSERGRVDASRASYHVQFDPMQLFRGVQSSVAIDRSGNWGYNGAPFGQNEILVKHLIAAAGGVSSLYDDIIRVIVPGTPHTGSALLQMNRYSNDYLQSAYANGDDGQLYKMELAYYPTSTDGAGYKLPSPDDVTGIDLGNYGTDKESYRWFFLHENNVERDEWDGIIELGRAFSKTGPALDAAVASLIDGSEWARCFALQTLCGVSDAHTRGNNHNIYFYQRPADNRMLALPWDWDFAFYTPTNASIFGDQNTAKVLQRPQYLRLYYAHLQDLMGTVFTTGYMSYWTAHYNTFCPGQDFSPLLSYIGNRRTYLLGQLPSPAALAISNAPADNTLAGSSSLALTGTAPWNAATLRLSGPGGVVNAGFSSINNWSATMPLLLGKNTVLLTAADVHGNLLQTQTFTVISTATSGYPDLNANTLPDAWEQFYGLGSLPGTTDTDRDGQSNLAEYLAGTNPRDPFSVFALHESAADAGRIRLGFKSLAGRNYRLLFRDQLETGPWQTLATFPPENGDQLREVIDTPPAGQPRRFYRLETP